MKRLPLLLVTVLLVVLPLSGANSKLLAPGLYQVTSLKGGNVLFYVGSSGVAVVDSGTTPREGKTVVDEIRSVTDKPILYLFLTHGHPDHVQGACAFPEGTMGRRARRPAAETKSHGSFSAGWKVMGGSL